MKEIYNTEKYSRFIGFSLNGTAVAFPMNPEWGKRHISLGQYVVAQLRDTGGYHVLYFSGKGFEVKSTSLLEKDIVKNGWAEFEVDPFSITDWETYSRNLFKPRNHKAEYESLEKRIAEFRAIMLSETENPDFATVMQMESDETHLNELCSERDMLKIVVEYRQLLNELKNASQACLEGQSQVAEELCHQYAEFDSEALKNLESW